MVTHFKRFLASPFFEDDEEKTRQAGLLHLILLAAMGNCLLLLPSVFFASPTYLPALVIISLWFPLALGSLFLLRRGRLKLAGGFFLGAGWFTLTFSSFIAGGVQNVPFVAHVALILIAGFIYGTRAGVIYTVLAILSGLGLLAAELSGRLPLPVVQTPSLSTWVGISMIFIAAATLVHLATRSLHQAITQARRNETALRQVEQRYRELFDEAPVMYVITRMVANVPVITECNSQFLRMLHYSRDQVVGRPLADFYSPASQQELLERGGYRRALEGAFEAEERQLVSLDSRVIEALLRARPETDAAGRAIGTRAMFVDITERKQIEAELDEHRRSLEELVANRTAELSAANHALRQSEERYRLISELISDYAYSIRVNPDGTIVNEWYTEALNRIVGSNSDETSEEFFQRTLHPDDRNIFQQQLQTLLSGSSAVNEYRILSPNRQVHWLRDYARPEWDEAEHRVVRIVGAAQDITEQRQAAESLHWRYQQLTLLNRAGQAFSSTLDLDEVLHTVLVEMQQLLQITAASFWFVEPETGSLVCRQAVGPGSDTVQGWRLAPGQGLAGWVAQTGQNLIVRDTATDERHFKGVDRRIQMDVRAILSIPMRIKEEITGVLNLVDTTPGRFKEDDLTLLEPLVASAAIAIENARLHAAVRTELAERKKAEEALRHLNEELERRVEERTVALTRSEQMFRALAENIREVFWVREGDRVRYISPAYEDVWGRSCASLYRASSLFAENVIAADRPLAAAALAAELNGQPFDEQLRLVRPDGSLRWVRTRSFPVQKDDGTVQSVGIAEDITERRRMEEQLATIYQLGQELALLLEEATVIQRVLEVAAQVLRINLVGCGLMDLSGSELDYYFQVGQGAAITRKKVSLADTSRPGLGQAVIAGRQALYVPDVTRNSRYWPVLDEFPGRAELCVLMQVGSRELGVLHAASATPDYFVPADRQLLQTLADQAAVAIENARLYGELRRGVVELSRLNADNARLAAAAQSRYREAEALRRAALTLTSTVDVAELLDRTLTELQTVISYDSAAVLILKGDYLEIISGQGFEDPATVLGRRITLQSETSPDYRVITSLKPVIISDTHHGPLTLQPITPATGLVRSWLGVPLIVKNRPIGMITLDKHHPGFYTETHAETAQTYAAQAAIALENARLYQDLQDQMDTLQATQAQLIRNERMAALGRLMASIAHEINNPLQGVQGFLSLLGEELNGRRRPEKINFYLSVANQEIDRIASIVHRMREFYRPASYKIELSPDAAGEFYHLTRAELQPIDIHTVLESVLQLANKKLQHSQITIERVWAEKLPLLEASADHLRQVFLNLTINAVDAMAEQGGVLRISTALVRARLSDDRPRRAIRIDFRDSGVGIPADVQPRLFEPLFSTKEHGTGFGLFTCYQIVVAHYGQITVESQVGAGTTFTILLPVKRPPREVDQEG